MSEQRQSVDARDCLQEEARKDLDNKTAKDDKGKDTQPDRRDGRLLHLLGTALQVGFGLAAARVLVLGELEVAPPLLGSLGHCELCDGL